jgi:thioesterase domain-containing protein
MLGGYSFGGYVALDMARQLAGAGRPVSKLVMIDTPAPKSDYSQFRTDLRSLLRAAANAPWWLADFATLEPSTMVRRVRRRARGLRRRPPVSGYEGTIDLGAFHDRVDAYPAEIQRLIEVFARALVDYVVRPYPGRVTLIRARTQPLLCSHDRTMGWAALATGGVEVVTCPGSHRTLLRPPYIAGVARRLGALLD